MGRLVHRRMVRARLATNSAAAERRTPADDPGNACHASVPRESIIRPTNWLTVLEVAGWLALLALPFGVVGALAHHFPDWGVHTAEVAISVGLVGGLSVRYRWRQVTGRARERLETLGRCTPDLLFETDEYGSNLPDAALRTRLREIASRTGLTYSVHLPLDLRLADDGAASHVSLVKAQRVIAATRELEPSAYTVHLDGAALMVDPGATELARWQEQARQSLATV
ncbi:MAG: hypothetical protein WCI61_11435, partial [Chloroflexota bacterium]